MKAKKNQYSFFVLIQYGEKRKLRESTALSLELNEKQLSVDF